MLQWLNNAQNGPNAWGTAFPTACYGALATPDVGTGGATGVRIANVVGASATGVTLRVHSDPAGTASPVPCFVLGWGK